MSHSKDGRRTTPSDGSRDGQLLGLDVRGLDHGRAFFDFGLVMRGKRLRRLLMSALITR